jgi:hypothetical protein
MVLKRVKKPLLEVRSGNWEVRSGRWEVRSGRWGVRSDGRVSALLTSHF